jgi:ubiquinone/menaquinone biosynthesis C-methylase UbiE
VGLFGWLRRRRTEKDNGASSGSLDAVMYGRKRTRGIPYMMPTDLEEMNRLDFQHNMLRYALHGNYAAPISHPKSILDVGTGTGRWAREMAQTFPQANLFEGLPFAYGSFDFVHIRLLIMAIPHEQWPQVIDELVRVTRPGGWVESIETTILQQAGPAMSQIIRWSTTVLAGRGVNLLDGENVGALLQAAGLE